MNDKARDDACEASVRTLAAALESATSMGRDISLCLARFHGPVCSAAAPGCSVGVSLCIRCVEPVCVTHLRTCAVCKVYVCPTCSATRNPMLHVPLHSHSQSMVWMCQRHVVNCAPVCMPNVSDVTVHICNYCRRGMCMVHLFGGAQGRLPAWQPRACHECLRRCVECHIQLAVRPVLFSDTDAYKAGVCATCWRHSGGEPQPKRSKAE